MEPILVNELTVTRERFLEGYAVVFSRRSQKTLLLCGGGTAVLGALAVLVQLLLERMPTLGAPLVFTGACLVVWAIFLPRVSCRQKYRALLRRSGESVPHRRVEFYSDSFTVFSEGASPADFDYADVEELRETEHLLILLCSGGQGVLLSKDGFLSGSEKELRKLLASVLEQHDIS